VSKLASLEESAASVEDGSHIAFGGFAITRCVVAVAHALVRARRRDLTLSQVVGGFDTDLLVGGGCVTRLAYSGGSLDRFGSLHAVNRAILEHEIDAEEYSSLALTLRLHAGGLGLPFIPTRSMLGSDLIADFADNSDAVRTGSDPFTGATVALLAPLRPDVAFIHVDVADEAGNATIGGPTWGMRETAFAAKRTVLLTEAVVAVGAIDPNSVAIPAPVVSSVIHAPSGAFPTAVVGRYDYNREHLTAYAAASKAGGSAYAEFLDEYVFAVNSHAEYLALAGGEPSA
jgi:acyl CoA:acetate/3-ketoacid CoA transferase alpha subunit